MLGAVFCAGNVTSPNESVCHFPASHNEPDLSALSQIIPLIMPEPIPSIQSVEAAPKAVVPPKTPMLSFRCTDPLLKDEQEAFVNYYCNVTVNDLQYMDLFELNRSWQEIKKIWQFGPPADQQVYLDMLIHDLPKAQQLVHLMGMDAKYWLGPCLEDITRRRGAELLASDEAEYLRVFAMLQVNVMSHSSRRERIIKQMDERLGPQDTVQAVIEQPPSPPSPPKRPRPPSNKPGRVRSMLDTMSAAMSVLSESGRDQLTEWAGQSKELDSIDIDMADMAARWRIMRDWDTEGKSDRKE